MPHPIKLAVSVKKVIKHTDTVSSYFFKPLRRVPKFSPGQFLHLAIDPYDPGQSWPESRVFSIASSPSDKDLIKITIAIKGIYTKRIYDSIKEGDIIWLKLPFGDFTFNLHSEKNYVFIAGGTGITPYISFLEYCLANNIDKSIKLFYGIRNNQLFIFDDCIEKCLNNNTNFKLVTYIEEDSKNANISQSKKGILNIAEIYQQITAKDLIYLSGPLEMINSFREYLIKHNINENNIIIDNWE
ncbi:MAG: FAD-dependent oxidoreductase [Spirochaetes bacterium]|nr:FAD-dependent oxidoreductase [Spirochaetota bacterium]